MYQDRIVIALVGRIGKLEVCFAVVGVRRETDMTRLVRVRMPTYRVKTTDLNIQYGLRQVFQAIVLMFRALGTTTHSMENLTKTHLIRLLEKHQNLTLIKYPDLAPTTMKEKPAKQPLFSAAQLGKPEIAMRSQDQGVTT